MSSIEQKVRQAIVDGLKVIEFEHNDQVVTLNKLISDINFVLGKLGYEDKYSLSIQGDTVRITLE